MSERLKALKERRDAILNGTHIMPSNPEWDDKLRHIAERYVCDSLEVSSLDEAALEVGLIDTNSLANRVEKLFAIPDGIKNTPFADSNELWWESVRDMIGTGNIFNFKGKPNYEGCLSCWKNKISEKYGFEPSKVKGEEFEAELESAVKSAASQMSRAARGGDVEGISKSARLMRMRAMQKRGSE